MKKTKPQADTPATDSIVDASAARGSTGPQELAPETAATPATSDPASADVPALGANEPGTADDPSGDQPADGEDLATEAATDDPGAAGSGDPEPDGQVGDLVTYWVAGTTQVGDAVELVDPEGWFSARVERDGSATLTVYANTPVQNRWGGMRDAEDRTFRIPNLDDYALRVCALRCDAFDGFCDSAGKHGAPLPGWGEFAQAVEALTQEEAIAQDPE
jgi:hypothetical protein